MTSLNLDLNFFRRLRDQVEVINAEDLDGQFSAIKTHINSYLTPQINNLVSQALAGEDADEEKFLQNVGDGTVKWSFIDSNVIPDGYISLKKFEKADAGDIPFFDENGDVGLVNSDQPDKFLYSENNVLSFVTLTENLMQNESIEAFKFSNFLVRAENIAPNTLTVNVREDSVTDSKFKLRSIASENIAVSTFDKRHFGGLTIFDAGLETINLNKKVTLNKIRDGSFSGTALQDGALGSFMSLAMLSFIGDVDKAFDVVDYKLPPAFPIYVLQQIPVFGTLPAVSGEIYNPSFPDVKFNRGITSTTAIGISPTYYSPSQKWSHYYAWHNPYSRDLGSGFGYYEPNYYFFLEGKHLKDNAINTGVQSGLFSVGYQIGNHLNTGTQVIIFKDYKTLEPTTQFNAIIYKSLREFDFKSFSRIVDNCNAGWYIPTRLLTNDFKLQSRHIKNKSVFSANFEPEDLAQMIASANI